MPIPTSPDSRRWVMALLMVVTLVASLASFTAGSAQPATPAAGESVSGTSFLLAPEGGRDLDAVRVELEPGTTTTVAIVLATDRSGPAELRTYAADAYTKVNGGYAARDEASEVQPPTTWLDYPASTISLAANQAHPLPLTIAVPTGTAPGQYVAAIVAQTAEPLAVPGTKLFNQVIRKSIPVIITVPGPIDAAATFGAPSVLVTESGATLVVPIENTGAIRVRPTGTLTLTDTSGTEVLTVPIAMGPVYAGHATTLEVGLPAGLPPGDYALSMDLTDDEGTGWTGSLVDVPVTVVAPATPVANAGSPAAMSSTASG